MNYIFSRSGKWIAFRVGRFVFDPEGHPLGWLPFDYFHVYDQTGSFLWRIWPDQVADDDTSVLDRTTAPLPMPTPPKIVRLPPAPNRPRKAN